MRRLTLALFASLLGLVLVALPFGPVAIELPGGSGGIGFDDLRFAPSTNVLLVPAGRTGTLDLVDPQTRVVSAIGGFSKTEKFGGGHGEGTTSADEGRGYLFATDRDSKEVAVVDPRAGSIVSRAKLSASPDYVRFVAPTGEVWVTEPDAEHIEIFRLQGKSPVQPVAAGGIAVKGGPESLIIDAKRGRAYWHLWGGSTVAIDLKTKGIVATWPNGCKGSRGIALDEERGFLFVGCGEGKAVVLNTADGRQLSSAASGDGVDIIDYNPKLGHLYFPGGKSATMATFAVSPNGALSLLGTVPTAPGAHCVAADLSGNAYVCDPQKGRLLVLKDPYPPGGKP
jgi:DNA-binding beta-propeller fold protein YncE